MRVFAIVAFFALLAGCQAAPPEMTPEEIGQIQTDVIAVMEASFEGFRQQNPDMIMEAFHPTETSWVIGSVPRDYAYTADYVATGWEDVESWEGEWTEAKVEVLSRDLALFQGTYEVTIRRTDGAIRHWPANASWTNLLKRTEGGWKVTVGANAAGSYTRIDPVFGMYDFTRLEGQDLPNEMYASATLEWRRDGSWTLTVTMPDGSEVVSNEGDSTVGPGPEGCLAATGWGYDTPNEPFSSTYCDGLLVADDGTWVAQQRG